MVRSIISGMSRTGAAGAVSGNPEARPFLKEKDQRVRHPDNGKGKPTCFKYSQPAAPCPSAGKATTTSPPFWTPATSGSASAPASGAGGLHRRDADPAAGDRLQPGAGARGSEARGAGPDSLRHHPRGLHHPGRRPVCCSMSWARTARRWTSARPAPALSTRWMWRPATLPASG